MAKLYKVRKKCMICGNVFYPRYAGSLYCEDCKNRKKEEAAKEKKPKAEKKSTAAKAKAPARATAHKKKNTAKKSR